MVDVRAVLRASRTEIRRNAAVLDHISCPDAGKEEPAQAASRRAATEQAGREKEHAGVAPPISKNVLAALFAALSEGEEKEDESANFACVENDLENHFLYGLVLPLVARLLAVSCPGLLCVVQLQCSDALSQCGGPVSLDGYASIGSHASKSVSHTTPSPRDMARAPSPSDAGIVSAQRKSLSPDLPPRTSELIRHAEKVLSGAEAAAEKRAAEGITESVDGTPSPDGMVQERAAQEHCALRLVCNGFEVLTGRMPPPPADMGSCTLASVGWEKAGVVSPDGGRQGLQMNFSNGMMIPTDGVVVTFSNGSLCYLTLLDPLAVLHSLQVADATPVVIFSFSGVRQHSVDSLLSQNGNAFTPQTSRVRAIFDRSNIFCIEIGSSACETSRNGRAPRVNAKSQSAKDSPLRGLSRARDNLGEPFANGKENSGRVALCCPPLSIHSLPRSVPLFVNTINRAFMDPSHIDIPKNVHKKELANDDIRGVHSDIRRRQPATSQPESNADEDRTAGSMVPTMSPPVKALAAVTPSATSSALPATKMSPYASGICSTVKMVTASHHPQEGRQKETPYMSGSHAGASTSCLQGVVTPNEVSPHLRVPAYGYHGYGRNHLHGGTSQNMARSQFREPTTSHDGMLRGHHQSGMQFAPPRIYRPLHPNDQPANGYIQFHHHQHPQGPRVHPLYHPMPPPTLVQHATQSGSHWHANAQPHRQHQAPMPPPHPLDARRDMPVQFSSHQAMASASTPRPAAFHAYPWPQPVMRHSSVRPCSVPQQNNVDPQKREVDAKALHPDGSNFDKTPTGRAGLKPGATRPDFPPCDPAVKVKSNGDDRRRIPAGPENRDGPVVQANDIQTDREKALHALIQMREGTREDKTKKTQKSLPIPKKGRSCRAATDTTSAGTERETLSNVDLGQKKRANPFKCKNVGDQENRENISGQNVTASRCRAREIPDAGSSESTISCTEAPANNFKDRQKQVALARHDREVPSPPQKKPRQR